MAKILKCPGCQEKIDVTDLSGGSTVKCEACGTMDMTIFRVKPWGSMQARLGRQ